MYILNDFMSCFSDIKQLMNLASISHSCENTTCFYSLHKIAICAGERKWIITDLGKKE